MSNKIPKSMKKSVRFVALHALERVEKGGAYSNLLINDAILKGKLSDKDARLLTGLVYGTISRQLLLDYYLSPFLKGAKKVDTWVRLLLRLSLFQLLYLDKVPDHAILNEATEIAKVRGNVGIGKFVNGVLRNVQRRGVPEIAAIEDPLERLATEISMPMWLTERFVQQIGEENTRKLGLSLFEVSHVSARVDLSSITRAEAIATLAEDGIKAEESIVSPYGIVAKKGFLAGSQLFHYGALTVQDESSMLVAPALQIEPAMKVLDACAAPGGKTTHIATFLDATAGGKVTALDIHSQKAKLIKENAARLRVEDVVTTQQLDAREAHEEFEAGTFDRILVDAPCSGLGLMRRKPDIKYQKQASDFERLPIIQGEILNSVAQTLKPGGLLVYSTCTILKEENQEVVARFLQAHPEFKLVPVVANERITSKLVDEMLTLYPQDFMTDGFFISCLKKEK